MKVGFTGTRTGMTLAQKSGLSILLGNLSRKTYPGGVLHHGDCAGADNEADVIAHVAAPQWHTVAHPGASLRWRAHTPADVIEDPKPELDRNKDIVDQTDVLIAAPKEGKEPGPARGQGTWSTVRYARNRHKVIYKLWPDGRIEEEAP